MNIFVVLGLNLVALAIGFLVLSSRLDRRVGSEQVIDEIRREVGSLLVELNQTTEQNIALIEERIDQLNEAVQKADQRITLLDRETERKQEGGELYTDIIKRSAERRRRDTVVSPEATAESTTEQILSLHRKGIAPNIIANRVGSTVGEIELIISLHDRKELS
ncbi:MAG: DUF6115 domain-containing protein [Spirochaetia bacterium]